nr:MAG TPA: hypothetical protein [Caudoviricetes sp.]
MHFQIELQQSRIELLQPRMISQTESHQRRIEPQLQRIPLQIILILKYQTEKKLLKPSLIELKLQNRPSKLRLVVLQ